MNRNTHNYKELSLRGMVKVKISIALLVVEAVSVDKVVVIIVQIEVAMERLELIVIWPGVSQVQLHAEEIKTAIIVRAKRLVVHK